MQTRLLTTSILLIPLLVDCATMSGPKDQPEPILANKSVLVFEGAETPDPVVESVTDVGPTHPYVLPDPVALDSWESGLEIQLDTAEQQASEEGRQILTTGRCMVFDEEAVVVGSCWTYINEVYNRAGYPQKKRQRVFKGAKKGPYAEIDLIQPGDWLYYINHSNGDCTHSGIFLGWEDYENKQGLILSYPGGRRKEPGRYRSYDLSSVYQIHRPRK